MFKTKISSNTFYRVTDSGGTCTVGYICDSIDGAIDGGVLLVHDESEHGEEGGVYEGDAKADDADWKHEDKEVLGEWDEEAGDSLQHQTDQGQRPLNSQDVKMTESQ